MFARSYMNVLHKMKLDTRSAWRPLLCLVPFIGTATLQVLWLAHPTYNNNTILHSPLLIPFLCFWGLQFASQVGKIILAHLIRSKFSLFDKMWILSIIGALDANLPWLLGR